MTTLSRTTPDNKDFLMLVQQLDAELAIRDGNEHLFYSQFNTLNKINHVVVAYEDGEPAGCGAIKEYTPEAMEVKRMFVLPAHRRKGIAARVLQELENWAAELKYSKCILETGKKQPEAIALYRRSGYLSIPNYDQYIGVENSVCFEKFLLQNRKDDKAI